MSTYRSFVRNAFDRLIEARMRQAERELSLHRRYDGSEWGSLSRGRKHS